MRNILIVFAFMALPLPAQQKGFTPVADYPALEQEINNNSLKIKSISSDFVQEKKMEYLDEVIVSKGNFWYKHESKLRWQYNEPYEYIIAINNGKFLLKDKGNVKVYDVASNPAFKEMNDLILRIARGTLAGDKRFKIEAFEDKDSYLLKLTPVDDNLKKFIHTTEVFLSKSDLAADRVVMHESGSDYTVIQFINRKINNEIADTVFDIR
ncbi:MAG: outer membrane lipoprotein carrier protein LolA [Bacteroidales bacterium]|jgi:outer membrane lipoprotein-sorting protein|nr:outer membrane lipoprotein carrier protein LolA [Bacteroidales bacterium]